MKLKKAITLQTAGYLQQIALRTSKSHDYASNDDCLKNLKVLADIADAFKKHKIPIDLSKPSQVAFWYMLQKVVRLQNIWSEGKEPQNESLIDTHNDLANYNEIAKECYIDEHGGD